MSIAQRLAALSSWTRYSVLAGIVALIVFAVSNFFWTWQPGRIGGLVFGTLAALLFINAALYPWRRRWGTRPLGSAQRWLKLHVSGSALAFWFVLIHTGFRWPAGVIGWLLLGLSFWATATGLLGVWLQRSVPRIMARRLTVEAIYERIPELITALVTEADALMSGASDALARAYMREIRPALATAQPSLKWVTGTELAASRLETLNKIRPFAAAPEKSRLDDLESIVQDKSDLDAQLSCQRLLRGWLVLHVPAAIMLIGLLAVHVFAVVWH